MSFAAPLKAAILRLPPGGRQALPGYAGVTKAECLRAQRQRPVSVNAHLRLCGVLAIDPLTGKPSASAKIGDFHGPSFAVALRMRRIGTKMSQRQVEMQTGVPYAVIRQIERGETVSAQNILGICRFLGRDPFDFVSQSAQNVSRETLATQTAVP